MYRLKNTSIGLLVLLGICFSAAVAVSGEASFGIENETTVIDQAGRKVDVSFPFHRIISLYGAHTENLFSLGAGAEVMGVSRNEAYPPEALTRPVFSYHDDPEKFMAVRPDLVLIRPMIDRGYPQFVRRLEKSGIVVVSLQPATIEEMYAYWRILGALTDRRARAGEMVRQFKEIVSGIRSITRKLPVRKKVYFEAIHSKMKTFSPESMAIFALETAGGINVASDAKSVRKTNIAGYGKERILSHSKVIDVYLAQYGAMNRPSISSIKNEPGFNIIEAVKNNQVFIIDEMIVSRPTLRLLEGVYKIGTILYPDVFTEKFRTALPTLTGRN